MENRVEIFNRILNLIKGSNREKVIFNMVEELFDRIKTSPASSRLAYHSCYEGGLMDHSNIVTLKMLADLPYYNVPLYSVVISGLFHDLGKIGSKTLCYYQPSELWKVQRGIPYEIPEEIKIIPHSSRSIYILSQFNVQLTEQEFQAIMYHNRLPEDSGLIKNYETPLLCMLHYADMYAAKILEKTYNYDEKLIKKLLSILDKMEYNNE